MRGKIFRLGKDIDESGLGLNIYIFTEAQSEDEEINAYPGIAVAPDGYIPVAGCLKGSGDPYFIKLSDGPSGCLYRVYHDAVREDGYDDEDAVAIVLRNYGQLLERVGT